MHRNRFLTGFSLMELAIVIAVVGLLAGGIVAGTGMVRSSETKSIVTDYQKYQGAFGQFTGRFKAVPGDMINATSHWGTASGGCPDGTDSGTGTCNGNGDKRITGYEMYRAWQHLANAGMLEGKYTGTVAVGGQANSHQGSLNVPRGKIAKTAWSAREVSESDLSGSVFSYDYSNVLLYGQEVTNDLPIGPALTPEEAYHIDAKVDDGNPGKGWVLPVLIDNCTNAASEFDYDAEYALSTNTKECALLMGLQQVQGAGPAVVVPPDDCNSPCGVIAHGATCTAYSAATVACGQTCAAVSEVRTCNDGTLSGSFGNAACAVDACAGCASPCGALAHGGTCTAYSSATVACGVTCASASETRTCTNGALSGSFTNAACSVDNCPPECTSGHLFNFDGECTGVPQCNHHNLLNFFCGGDPNCSLQNMVFDINTCAVCHVTTDVCIDPDGP